jgi:F0F1-type ATP synthase assembly protein I
VPQKNNPNRFAKYSGLAFQLVAYIAIGYFIGNFIDSKIKNETPYATAGFCTFFLIIGFYTTIRDVIKSEI